jgi:uncharacterized membrane protein
MRHRQAIAVLALVGLLVSLYLTLHRLGIIGVLQCGTGSCEKVQTSAYAIFLGIPVPYVGVGGYLGLLAVSLAGLQPGLLAKRGVTRLLAGMAALGFAFTLYLTFVELFIIHAICRWCVGSAVIITAITAVALHAFVTENRASLPTPRTGP